MPDEITATSDPLPIHPFLAWFEKNIRLIIPCMILILFSGLSLVGFLLASVIYKAMKSTDAYQAAWAIIVKDEDLRDRFGDLRQGWSVSGKIQLQGEEGNADFSFPIHGTKGKFIATFKGTKSHGEWDFTFIEFRSADPSIWKKTPVNSQLPKETHRQ